MPGDPFQNAPTDQPENATFNRDNFTTIGLSRSGSPCSPLSRPGSNQRLEPGYPRPKVAGVYQLLFVHTVFIDFIA